MSDSDLCRDLTARGYLEHPLIELLVRRLEEKDGVDETKDKLAERIGNVRYELHAMERLLDD
jgi:hypothetical protein